MTRLLIGNDFNEYVRDDRTWVGWWVQRLVWFAQDGDVLVLPCEPQAAFFDYVTDAMGIDASSLSVVVPPPGLFGGDAITADRLADQGFREAVRKAIDGRPVERVFALWPDASVARLARWLGVASRLPGAGFLDQGGGVLLNSKAAFRAVAAGVGISLPAGGVCNGQAEAEELIMDLFRSGELVMVKQEFLSGARGNEILSPTPGVRPLGARRVVVVPDRTAVRSYLAERWDWLTNGGRSQVIVERFLRDATSVFAEFDIADEAITFEGEGEMLLAPFGVGEIIPTPGLDPDLRGTLIDQGRVLCEALHAMGYRGLLSADAIFTPEGEIVFTEFNGRVTGSTHIYGVIGKRLVGADYAERRVLMERIWPSDWSVPSFEEALDRITSAHLAYDPQTQTGVVLSSALDPNEKSVVHVIVAEDLDGAWKQQEQVERLFRYAG